MAAGRKRTVEIEVVADTKQASSALKGVESKMGKTGQAFSNVGKVLAGAAIGAKVVDFAQQSIQAFSELEQSVGGTEAVFGSTSKVIDEFAKNSAESMGLSEAEFRTATTSMGGQLKRLTGDVEFAADQSIILTQTAADLAATYGGTTAEAVQALGAAFRGEADPAERFNLDLKVSRVNAKAVEMGLAETTSSVDDYAKAQATIALIMEQSSDAQGQFARELDTVAGQAQVTQARLTDLKAEVGEKLAPAFVSAVQGANNLLDTMDEEVNLGWSQKLSAFVQQISGESPEAVAAYIEQKSALNDYKDAAEAAHPIMTNTFLAANDIAEGMGASTEATWKAVPSVEALAAAMEKEREVAEAAMETRFDYLESLKEVHDPLFKIVRGNEQLAEAEKAVSDAEKKYGDDSPEYRAAVIERAEALVDLEGTYKDLKAQGINPTGEAARKMLEDLDIPPDVINDIFGEFDKLEKNLEGRDFRIRVSAPNLAPKPIGQGGIGWTQDGVSRFHQGTRRVPGVPGEDVLAVLQAGEEVKRRSEVADMTPAAPAPAPGVTLVFEGPVYGMDDFERRVVEATRRFDRRFR